MGNAGSITPRISAMRLALERMVIQNMPGQTMVKLTLIIKAMSLTTGMLVPYCPYLSTKYNCHINVEVCASVKAVKYIHKYIYKGHDLCTVQVDQKGNANAVIDKIKEYIDGCYIGPVEACWHIFLSFQCI
jgi:hypothetical protein